MSDDLMPQCLRRIENAVRDSHGLLILDLSIIVLDGKVQRWHVAPTQYEPHNANRPEARADLLRELIATRGGDHENQG